MKIILIMMLYLNMASEVQLGGVKLANVTEFEITESIDDVSNTAKITIPRVYQKLNEKSLLEQINVGDKVVIKAGYYADGEAALTPEFTGYIREVGAERPLAIYCDDESYILHQTSYVKSYKAATLAQVLKDVMPAGVTVECPDVALGKFHIDNASAFAVLKGLREEYGLYSRLQDGVLKVGLRDMLSSGVPGESHTYTLNPTGSDGNFVKKNELKFKRKEDYQLRVKATAIDATAGQKKKKVTAEVGSKREHASVLHVTYPGKMTEQALRAYAASIYNKRCYDGYTGSVTGFGTPRVHAGDAITLIGAEDAAGNFTYLVEKVTISYNSSEGFSRKCDLSYKIG
jgi:hypothetical protein